MTLPLGHHPVTLRQLAAQMGVSRREAEAQVQLERLAGRPIVSDGNGVRLARTSVEVAECAQRLRVRAAHQFITARALARTAKRLAAEEARPLAFFFEDAA